MMDVIIDAGHGGDDTGVIDIIGLKEKEYTLIIAKKCGEYLINKNVNVKFIRENDTFISTNERIQIANENGEKLFISIHVNSVSDANINGCEIYTLTKGSEGEKLAINIMESITSNVNLESRGIKFGEITLLKNIKKTSVLIQVCYSGNSAEEMLLRDDIFKNKLGEAIGNGIIEYINNNELDYPEGVNNFSIVGEETASDIQAMQWAKDKGATEKFIALAKIYWKFKGAEYGGVNPVIAYAQAALESNYGKYNNNIDESFKNPCVLRKKDYSEDSYEKFDSWEKGVIAHIDHLALYGGANGYPKVETPDSRHFSFLLGRAKNILDLSGNWSPMKTYGKDILKYVEEINSTEVKDKFEEFNINKKITDKKINKLNLENYKKIKDVKFDIIELYDILVKLKEKVDSINTVMGSIESDLESDELKSEELLQKNKSLSEKISNYETAINSALDLLKNEKK